MKQLTGLLLILILCVESSFAQDIYDLVEEGNNHYINGEFESAINKYEAVLDSGYESPELYYNLGNAYFKSHKLTMALVQYERALLLDPNDEEIKHNLAMARQYVVDEIDELPELLIKKWYRTFITFLTIDQWAYISISTFILALVLFLIYLLTNTIHLRKLAFWLAIVFLLFAPATYVFSYHRKKNIYDHNYAIIFPPSVTIKGSPDNSGTDLFQLHEGTKVEIIDQLGEWREIRLSDGNVGWLKAEDLVKI